MYTQSFKDENNWEVINPEDKSNDYPALYISIKQYAILLSPHSYPFIAYAENEEEALDIVGDYILQAGYVGYILSNDQCEELIADGLEDSIMYIGNDGTPVNGDNINIWEL